MAAAVMPKEEIDRRYGRIREAMARDGLDAVIVSGNEYTGFEGAVTYMSGFVIVHRYAYVLLPLEGEPSIVFPREATYVGEHGTTWIDEQVFVDKPGEWLADQVRGKRVGVYGLDYVMTVRDYRALARRRRDRAVGRRVRPRACRQERARARVGARQRPHQHRGLLDLPRALRARQDRARDPRALRAVLRRAGLRPPDDGHGARRRRRRRSAGVQDRRRLRDQGDRHGAAVARDRRRRRPLGRGLARDLRRASRATRRRR